MKKAIVFHSGPLRAQRASHALKVLFTSDNRNIRLIKCRWTYKYSFNQETFKMDEMECHLLRRHKDSVLCCNIDSKSDMLVSAGVDDTAFVWDLQTKDVKFECTGHKDSVSCCGFNVDSSLVATADMSGLVQVWETKSGKMVSSYDVDEVQWLTWHNISPKVLLVGTKTGEFWMWQVGEPGSCKVFPSFNTATTNGRLLDNGSQILVSYEDGSLRTLNLKTEQVDRYFKDNDHNPEIVCLDLSPDDRYIALGCIDSKVKIISHSTFKLLKIFSCSTPLEEKKKIVAEKRQNKQIEIDDQMTEENEELEQEEVNEPLEIEDEFDKIEQDVEQDGDDEEIDDEEFDDVLPDRDVTIDDLSEAVEAICFSKEADYLVAANTCGSVYIWQVSNQLERAVLHLNAGVSRALWTAKNHCILGCLDGSVRVFDVNLKCLDIFHIHQQQILDLNYQDGLLVTASDDKAISLLKYPRTDQ